MAGSFGAWRRESTVLAFTSSEDVFEEPAAAAKRELDSFSKEVGATFAGAVSLATGMSSF